jgi:hypothetical protein
LGVATAPRTGALGLETPGNRVGGGSVSYVTAETLPFKNWATFGFRRYSALRLNFRQQRIHYTRDQPQKLDSRRHDIRYAGMTSDTPANDSTSTNDPATAPPRLWQPVLQRRLRRWHRRLRVRCANPPCLPPSLTCRCPPPTTGVDGWSLPACVDRYGRP